MLTGSSFGREIDTLRADTEAMSSRTTSSDCAGTLKRSMPAGLVGPDVGVELARSAASSVTCVRRARTMRAAV